MTKSLLYSIIVKTSYIVSVVFGLQRVGGLLNGVQKNPKLLYNIEKKIIINIQKGKEMKKKKKKMSKTDTLPTEKKNKKEMEFELKLAREKEEILEREKQMKINRLLQEVQFSLKCHYNVIPRV